MKTEKCPPLVSETLPLKKLSRGELFGLITKTRQPSVPIALKGGSFYFPHGGAYQLFEAVDGTQVGIWAKDPDDLSIGDYNVKDDDFERLQMCCPQQGKVGVPAGIRLPDRLYAQGNDNLSRLRVFAIKPAGTPYKWFEREMLAHHDAHVSFSEDYSTLFRHGHHKWVSEGIVYELEDTRVKGAPAGHKDLCMFAAPGHGWRLGSEDAPLLGGLSGKFMRQASVRAKNVSLQEAETIVTTDFKKRAPLFIEGLDPYSILLNGEARQKATMQYKARKMAVRLIRGTNRLEAKTLSKGLGWLVLGNGAIAAGLHFLGASFSPFVFGGKLLGQVASKTGKQFLTYLQMKTLQFDDPNIATLMQRYAKGWNESQFWGGKLDTDMVPYLKSLTHAELNTSTSFDSRIYETLPERMMALEYIYGMMQGPAGSLGVPFAYGSTTGIRIDEPNGLSVEYFSEKRTCFARIDQDNINESQLPNLVIDLFAKAPADKPYFMVRYAPDTRTLEGEFLSQSAYHKKFQAVAQTNDYADTITRKPDPVTLVLPTPQKTRLLDTFTRLLKGDIDDTAAQAIEEAAETVAENMTKIRPSL